MIAMVLSSWAFHGHHFGIKEVLRPSLVDPQELLPSAKVALKAEALRA
jgi:hypothetical protein